MEQQLSRLKKRSQQVSRVLSVLHTFTASPLAARILLGCAHNLGSLLCLVGVYVCVLTRWTLQMVATVNSTTADAAARALADPPAEAEQRSAAEENGRRSDVHLSSLLAHRPSRCG